MYLTNEELQKLKDIADAKGIETNSRIVKLAISELHVNADTLHVHRPYGEKGKVRITGMTALNPKQLQERKNFIAYLKKLPEKELKKFVDDLEIWEGKP